MSKIIVAGTPTDIAEAGTLALLNGGFVAESAEINYNFNKGLPPVEEIDRYPLIMEGRLAGYKTKVYVYSVTAGYGGTGPRTLASILKTAGFYFEEEDILTKRMANSSGQISLFLRK